MEVSAKNQRQEYSGNFQGQKGAGTAGAQCCGFTGNEMTHLYRTDATDIWKDDSGAQHGRISNWLSDKMQPQTDFFSYLFWYKRTHDINFSPVFKRNMWVHKQSGEEEY